MEILGYLHGISNIKLIGTNKREQVKLNIEIYGRH